MGIGLRTSIAKPGIGKKPSSLKQDLVAIHEELQVLRTDHDVRQDFIEDLPCFLRLIGFAGIKREVK
jgi:hypothetical protein